MKQLLREPLVHFLIVGAALVAASSFVSDSDIPRDDQIVISAGQIEHLAARYARTWQRPPTLEELQGLIDEYVREEVAYREGMAIGLDRDDAIIRRRIRQKLDFIAVDIASLVDPTQKDLEDYLADHPDDFRVKPRFTFVQVFFDPGRRGDDLQADADRTLDKLNSSPAMDVRELGDRTMMAATQKDISLQEISSLFGRDFATAMETLQSPADELKIEAGDQVGTEQGPWFGPFESGYGLHLVRLVSVTETRLPRLEEIREVVRREWENSRRSEAKNQFYRELIERYEITVEWPEPAEEGGDR